MQNERNEEECGMVFEGIKSESKVTVTNQLIVHPKGFTIQPVQNQKAAGYEWKGKDLFVRWHSETWLRGGCGPPCGWPAAKAKVLWWPSDWGAKKIQTQSGQSHESECGPSQQTVVWGDGQSKIWSRCGEIVERIDPNLGPLNHLCPVSHSPGFLLDSLFLTGFFWKLSMDSYTSPPMLYFSQRFASFFFPSISRHSIVHALPSWIFFGCTLVVIFFLQLAIVFLFPPYLLTNVHTHQHFSYLYCLI